MRDMVRAFLDYLTSERGLSGNTVAAYGNDLVQLVEFLEESGGMRAASADSRINAEPQALLTTFFAGQPKLMSIRSAPLSRASRAASAMTAGSAPASWSAAGRRSRRKSPLSRDLRVRSTIVRLATISEKTSPAPKDRTRRRKGRSVTPDMGASRTGASSVILPI